MSVALLDGRGRLNLKGSAFRSAASSRSSALIERSCACSSPGAADVKAVIDRWLADFAAHRVDVRTFARTETLQEPLEIYRERVASGVRAPSAAYELAAAGGRPVQPGDQISYYVTGRTARVPVNEAAKLASLWDREHPDETSSSTAQVWKSAAFPTLHERRSPLPREDADRHS